MPSCCARPGVALWLRGCARAPVVGRVQVRCRPERCGRLDGLRRRQGSGVVSTAVSAARGALCAAVPHPSFPAIAVLLCPTSRTGMIAVARSSGAFCRGSRLGRSGGGGDVGPRLRASRSPRAPSPLVWPARAYPLATPAEWPLHRLCTQLDSRALNRVRVSSQSRCPSSDLLPCMVGDANRSISQSERHSDSEPPIAYVVRDRDTERYGVCTSYTCSRVDAASMPLTPVNGQLAHGTHPGVRRCNNVVGDFAGVRSRPASWRRAPLSRL